MKMNWRRQNRKHKHPNTYFFNGKAPVPATAMPEDSSGTETENENCDTSSVSHHTTTATPTLASSEYDEMISVVIRSTDENDGRHTPATPQYEELSDNNATVETLDSRGSVASHGSRSVSVSSANIEQPWDIANEQTISKDDEEHHFAVADEEGGEEQLDEVTVVRSHEVGHITAESQEMEEHQQQEQDQEIDQPPSLETESWLAEVKDFALAIGTRELRRWKKFDKHMKNLVYEQNSPDASPTKFLGFDSNGEMVLEKEDESDENIYLPQKRQRSKSSDNSEYRESNSIPTEDETEEEESLLKPMSTPNQVHKRKYPNVGRPKAYGTGGRRSAQDDYYKEPFKHGWRRELVWRSNPETSKDKADIYFISPGGKKLRKRSEIEPLLKGDLTIDHFCFAREPLGASPDLELVRHAKPSARTIAALATGTPGAKELSSITGKRTLKPKVPKGASPPQEDWTPTKAIKDNNALLNSVETSPGLRTRSKKRPPSQDSSTNSNRCLATNPLSCTVNCAKGNGKVPQLQCVKCSHLFHHACVGLDPATSNYRLVSGGRGCFSGEEYICEICKHIPPKKTLFVRLQRCDHLVQQRLVVVKGKKYVSVNKPKPVVTGKTVQDAADFWTHLNKSVMNRLFQFQKIEKELDDTPSTSKHAMKQLNIRNGSSPAKSEVSAESGGESSKTSGSFFCQTSIGYDVLVCILRRLSARDRATFAQVCRLWNIAARDNSLWAHLSLQDTFVADWQGLASLMQRGQTKTLRFGKPRYPSDRMEEWWENFSESIATVTSLEAIEVDRCPARVVESLFFTNPRLRYLSATSIDDVVVNLENVNHLVRVEELHIRSSEFGVMLASDLDPLAYMTQLRHLTLANIRQLGTKNIEMLANLSELRSLVLGECGQIGDSFASIVLPNLHKLIRLRLENSQESASNTFDILDAVAQLPRMEQLELINFDVKENFEYHLSGCTNIRRLLVIPTYQKQSGYTNFILLKAVHLMRHNLEVFTWGVTVELLRVTAMYVDTTRGGLKEFKEYIPVLKPIPGTQDYRDLEASANGPFFEKREIEIVPLINVEEVLKGNLTTTKCTIVRVPLAHAYKQNLIQ